MIRPSAAVVRLQRRQRYIVILFIIAFISLYCLVHSAKINSEIPAPVAPESVVEAGEGAFVTIMYDFGEDSEALLLATRVLMRSIKDSNTIYRRMVVVPQDGLQESSEQVLKGDDSDLEIVHANIPNVFAHMPLTDHRTQLLHMRNKLVIWDNPEISSLKRVVYLDPENLVLRNLDEIFACHQFCAVDNGQSVVYSNGLLVISPDSIAARNLYSDAIDSFMITGREYNYVGIIQGFMPGLFEAFEESPLFFLGWDGDDNGEENNGADNGDATEDVDTSVVHRLPFYYSINHMVFYERMNWDLYKCKDKNLATGKIPGPLLSYKYSGGTVKPWFWLPYVYFQVFWHWQEVRERLEEDHVGFFLGKLMSFFVIFVFIWFAYISLCLKLFTESNGRPRRLSSWRLPTSGNGQSLSIDVFNSRVVRRACQFSCSALYAIASMPLLSSVCIVILIMYCSIHMIPVTMQPSYAGRLWLIVHDLWLTTLLLIFAVAHTLRTAQWKKDDVPATSEMLLSGIWWCIKKLPLLVLAQLQFLYIIGRTDWFQNPVLRPVMTCFFFAVALFVEGRILIVEMRRLTRN
ncbi:glucuronosyltransferase pgsip8-like [Plasmopara halstedii]|uniref:Glucuronosyltransferase pgsip8-like n=1 Tax=Plasmopara halstedii TaxID=4781 RepID=A0A0P1AFV6_PLAHL|nr:glucuronosyltransferase pgsip8-like [Plasmopara halstedii]CEG39493.1 glucuronosyltransferase pgsip8-like [Plasmopara halstedii]|eukprot:XP_024575862.1 glucuronosyltransferase pgsip8-like [Plasmopara halstedii]